MAQQQGGDNEQKAGLLDGLSVSQVVATAAAAVTSTLFASQIGIAGSIIGVAVASVVSTVASQLYRGMLTRSADKLSELREGGDADASGAGAHNVNATDSADARDDAMPNMTTPLAAGKTRVMTSAAGNEGLRMAPESLRAEAARRRQDALRRRVSIAALVAGLVAVAVTAFAITLFTHGEGLGEKPVASTPTTEQATSTTTSQRTTSSSSTAKTQQSASNDTSSTTTDSQTSNSHSASTSDSTSSSSDETDSTSASGSTSANGSTSSSSSNNSTATDSSNNSTSTDSSSSSSSDDSSSSAGGDSTSPSNSSDATE